MTTVNKYLLKRVFLMPIAWLGLTSFAGGITWYHGYAIYFVTAMLILTLLATCWVLSPKGAEGPSLLSFIFSAAFIFSCVAFDVYALILLFFPQWNGWNGWNADGKWPQIYFQLPPDFNYSILFVFLGIILIFGGKKFFELDLDAMKKRAYKKKEVVRDHIYYIKGKYGGNAHSFEIIYKPRFLVKSEHWLHAIAVGFCCYVILPFGGAAGAFGVTMGNSESSPFTAAFFFLLGYFFLCLSVYLLVQAYGGYRLIVAIQKELGIKLKPAVYPANE